MSFLQLKIPPVVLVAIFALAMWLSSKTFFSLAVSIPYAASFATVVLILGIIVAIAGVIAFRKAQTTVDPRTPEKSSSLVNTGIYKVTRNPMYLGFLLLLIAYAIYLSHILAFGLAFIFVLYMNAFQIKPEEHMLATLFGEDYEMYCRSVRRWL
ncbi:isoprenylcysteine carboxylmethyltransferase family protein [Thalassotalea sp. M1531]|uniref:Isoprenylcysteine carboxylmethyltransferase family protein n=1 Tax=Thalassotalea algicola TaxID=2716224 RepID=A0A7Y0Q7L2_9GAMM|nr:isoprenylcysteine carboxylmethyltransferase family protein [Thalassotalea algicola]NMP32523.1 isoprenylcysteine carboxylmethyltransferase family protein [Thalassotalea algicola]